VLQAVLLPERPNLLAPQNGIFAVEPKVYALTGSFEWSAFLQAEQHIELPGPFPTGGSATSTTTVCALHDLGAAALVDVETGARNEADGALLFWSRATAHIRGAGGWGGNPPSMQGGGDLAGRPPDFSRRFVTGTNQALLYRLLGDRYRLHSDTAFAARAGFTRPILHGLCTFGHAAQLWRLSHAPGRVGAIGARFTRPVCPGDPLDVSAWRVENDELRFRVQGAGGMVVLDEGYVRLQSPDT
jgi:acyl dehydratase